MKVIEILKARLKELESASKIVKMDNSQERFKVPILNIIKAIEELEELEIRNCKGCKHYGEYEYEICGAEDFTRIVKGCTLLLKIFEDGFCCNKWEAKNENL